MPAKVPITITDLKTGEVRTFDYYAPACDWINSLTGLKIQAGNITSALGRSGYVAKKRFKLTRNDGYIVEKKHLPGTIKKEECDRHLRKNGWLYEQYCISQNVIVAEKKIKWYDVEKLEELKTRIKRMGYFFSYARTESEDKYYKSQKQTGRVELYMKFSPNIDFKEKVKEIDKAIEKIGL